MVDAETEAEPGPTEEDNFFALIEACFVDLKRADALLRANPNLVHERTPHMKETPLHFLAIENQLEGVRLLRAYGAEINTRNASGDTPLSESASVGSAEMVRWLLGEGAEVSGTNELGETALHEAAAGSSLEIVQLLVTAGAEVNARNRLGETPLHRAVRSDSGVLVAEFLLECGAEANAREMFESTPLHVAASNGAMDAAALLRGRGADLYAVDARNRTAADLAEEYGHTNLAQWLRGGKP